MSIHDWRLLIVATLVAHPFLPPPAAASDCDDCGNRGCHAGTVADEFIADRVGLVREWIVQLPFDSSRGQLRHVTITDGLVVATSGDGKVHAIATGRGPAGPAANPPAKIPVPDDVAAADPATASPAPPQSAPGSILWSTQVRGAGGSLLPAGIGGSTVALGNDLGLVAFDADRGVVRWRDNVGTPTAAAAPIGESVYIPLTGGRIHRAMANPMSRTNAKGPAAAPTTGPAAEAEGDRRPRRGRRAATEQASRPAGDHKLPNSMDSGGRLDRPVMPFGDGIAWTTTGGLLVALGRNDSGWERHEFDLLSAAADAPLVRGKSVFVATVAGDLARVDMPPSGPRGLRTGWHTVLDGRPDAGPFLGGNTLVVSLGDDGLAAFTADAGSLLWRSPVAGKVLAVGGDRIWLIDRVGRLSAIDMKTGERREQLCLGCLTLPIVNAVNDRLLLASGDGLLVCLAPNRPVPDAFPAPTPAKKPTKRPGAEPTAEDVEEAAENPAAEAPAAEADR